VVAEDRLGAPGQAAKPAPREHVLRWGAELGHVADLEVQGRRRGDLRRLSIAPTRGRFIRPA